MLPAGLIQRLSSLVLVCLALVLSLSGSGLADTPKTLKGVALVIGQSKYEHLDPLINPGNDAQGVAKLFTDLGFNVTTTLDRDTRKLRRDLANFAVDAEGSDVAVVYYSGHGIEAGGENWLVPVDADVAALDDAAKSLVPLSSLMAELNASVPLTLLFLDACRTNPFPPGAALKRDGTALPVRASGLALTRGVSAADADAGSEGLGAVIAFAAEPGMVALDGPPDSTSPYASAILRHLSASTGSEFGTVMRLVTQEVYLRTGGRQRPWVNETLTRLLYFGAPQPDLSGDEGQILSERRQVLLTIAALDDSTRKQVEAAARQADVPMDALYGLLNALGADIPRDPSKLDAVLKAQTETVKSKLAVLDALGRQDAEVARLSALADRALADGAIQANLRFMQAADARQKAVDGNLDQTEADLRTSRLASGATKAKLAEAYALNFAFDKAAQSYDEAFQQVEKWDRPAAFDYKLRSADALLQHGDEKGDNEALMAAIEAYRAAQGQLSRDTDPVNWASTQNDLGNALQTLGSRESGATRLEEAVQAYRAALGERTRERLPLDWAMTQNNLGNALWALGSRESGTARLQEAIQAYRDALEERKREHMPLDWASTQNNLGSALQTLGSRESGTARLEEAVQAYRAALEERTRERVPLDWATTQNNLGQVLWTIGARESGTARLEEAVAAYRLSLEERTRARVPLQWALTQNNLGNALQTLGSREKDTARLEEAVTIFRTALEERSREIVPGDWATTQDNLGAALYALGLREHGSARLEEAVTAYRAALVERKRETVPLEWAATQNNLGNALRVLGSRDKGTAMLEEAVEAYRAALEEITPARVPLQWAGTLNNLGTALKDLGSRESGTTRLEESVASFRAALDVYSRETDPPHWAMTQNNLGTSLDELGSRENNTTRLEEAVTAFRAALDVYSRETDPLDWAMTQNNLGWVLGKLGHRLADPTHVRAGREAVQAAWEMYRSSGFDYDAYFRERIEAFDTMMAEIGK
ncbi:caspase family protein [Aestuariivirga sp.]|uniref:caspase family protein n=1 Tax=Aestuariivirga sp. TaxID=2650926 RepID=UPI0035937A38